MIHLPYALPRLLLAAAVSPLLALGQRARAQEPMPDHSCTVSAAFLEAVPVSSGSENFEPHGWGFQAGLGFAVTPNVPKRSHAPQWYITADYLFTKIQATQYAATHAGLSGVDSAHGAFSAVTLNVGPRVHLPGALGLDGKAGFGWLQRGITFNGPSGTTLLQTSSPTLARGDSDSGVFDAALAVTFSPAAMKGLSLFVEGRVLHGLAINRTTTLVPASVGIRW